MTTLPTLHPETAESIKACFPIALVEEGIKSFCPRGAKMHQNHVKITAPARLWGN